MSEQNPLTPETPNSLDVEPNKAPLETAIKSETQLATKPETLEPELKPELNTEKATPKTATTQTLTPAIPTETPTETPTEPAKSASEPSAPVVNKPSPDLDKKPHGEGNGTSICLVNRSKREFTDEIIGKPKKPRNKLWAILGILLLALAWVAFLAYKTLYSPAIQPKQMLTLDKGETYYGLVDEWDKKHKLFFAPLAKLYVKTHVSKPLHSGVYPLPENPTFVQLLDVLQQGEKVAFIKVQAIDGKTAKDLYKTLNGLSGIKKQILSLPADQQAKALALPIDPSVLPEGFASTPYANNLEGWFSPDTYYFSEGTTDKKVLTDLFTRQQNALLENWKNRQPDLPYKNPYEALIMASIIEKETSVPAERNEVAGVFVNRLKQGMRLQTDPTVIYGMGERYNGNITKADLAEKTDYNTYQIDGLPPTPIALPSVESIKASLHPNQTDSLYFVATGKGGHKFTSNLADHNKAVQEYLQVMREKKAQGQ